VTEEDDRKREEEHVAKVLSKCGYPPWSIDRVKQEIVEKSLKDETKKVKNTKGNHKGMVVVPYVKELSEAFARILKSHSIATANRPHRTLRNFDLLCPLQELLQLLCWRDRQEVWSEDQGTQERSGLFHNWSRAWDSSVTHKSANTDHAVEENHVIDWHKAEVVDREAQ